MSNGASRRSKAALVLAGGGVAGAVYEIGALCAIDELLDDFSVNDLDIFVGTSAGALISACIANGISPRTMLAILDSPMLGIDSLEPHHLFSFNLGHTLERSRRLPAAVIDALRRLIMDGGGASLLDIVETVAVGMPTGLYDNDSLELYLRQTLSQPGRSNSFKDLPHELAIIATDLDTGDRAVFGEPPLDEVTISQAVCASAALPLFYRPVRINGHDYIDGGVRGTASLDVAIERGAEVILCINPMVPYDNSRHGIGRAISDEGMQSIGNQVFRTFVHAGLHYHLKQVRRRHPAVDIIMIEPRRDDPVMFTENMMSYRMRLAIARHGFESVTSHLREHHDYYEMLLSRHNIRINLERVERTSDRLRRASSNSAAVLTALSAAASAHTHPAGLSQTLAELDRVLERMERRTVTSPNGSAVAGRPARVKK